MPYDEQSKYPDNEYPERQHINALGSNEVVDDIMQPTEDDSWAYICAVEDYRDYQAYNQLPYEGGLMDQPYMWKLGVDTVMHAVSVAKSEAYAAAKAAREENRVG